MKPFSFVEGHPSSFSIMPTVPKNNKRAREVLADRIDISGFEMFPCSNCKRKQIKCVLSNKENCTCCAKCLRRGAKCDVEGIPIKDWESLELEEARLRCEEEAAY